MKIYHKGKLIFTSPETPGMLSVVMLPNLAGDGKTLLVQENLIGWFTSITVSDEIEIEYG